MGRGRLNHDEVDADWQPRKRTAVGKSGRRKEATDRPPQPRPFAPVKSLFGQPEVATAAPADLDDDERPWRAGIDRDDIELAVA